MSTTTRIALTLGTLTALTLMTAGNAAAQSAKPFCKGSVGQGIHTLHSGRLTETFMNTMKRQGRVNRGTVCMRVVDVSTRRTCPKGTIQITSSAFNGKGSLFVSMFKNKTLEHQGTRGCAFVYRPETAVCPAGTFVRSGFFKGPEKERAMAVSNRSPKGGVCTAVEKPTNPNGPPVCPAGFRIVDVDHLGGQLHSSVRSSKSIKSGSKHVTCMKFRPMIAQESGGRA